MFKRIGAILTIIIIIAVAAISFGVLEMRQEDKEVKVEDIGRISKKSFEKSKELFEVASDSAVEVYDKFKKGYDE